MTTKTVKVICPICGSEKITIVWEEPVAYLCKVCGEAFGE